MTATLLAVDPGASGALAVVDKDGALLDIQDMPVRKERGRKRIDRFQLFSEIEALYMIWGFDLAVLEAVGGRPSQSASAAFVFGMGYAFVLCACDNLDLRIEQVEPSIWKPSMRAPKDKKEAVGRADELWPQLRASFRTKRNALRPDRAEAAMLGLYGARRWL